MEKHYKIVNLTKREFVHPHKLNTGLKLCDIYHSRRIGQAVILLCTDPSSKEEVLGRWAGDRIALVNLQGYLFNCGALFKERLGGVR